MESKIHFVQDVLDDHPFLEKEPKYGWVGVVMVDNFYVGLSLNCKDQRGYRWTIYLINHTDMKLVINRFPNSKEASATSKVCEIMTHIFSTEGLIVEHLQGINNSDNYVEGILTRGIKDPYRTGYWYGWVRGVPNQEYIPGIPLRVPQLGESFDIFGSKVPWESDQQMSGAISWIRNKLINTSLKKWNCRFSVSCNICPFCINNYTLITEYPNFRVFVDDDISLIVVSKNHLNRMAVYNNKLLYDELCDISIHLRRIIKSAFGEQILFNECCLSDMFVGVKEDHFHQYLTLCKDLKLQIGILEYSFSGETPCKEEKIRDLFIDKILETTRIPTLRRIKTISRDSNSNNPLSPRGSLISDPACSFCGDCQQFNIFTTANYKVIIDKENQYMPGRMIITFSRHQCIDERLIDDDLKEEWRLIVCKACDILSRIYDSNVRVSVCEFMKNKNHGAWYIIPRSPGTVTIGKEIYEDIMWNKNIENNLCYKLPESQLRIIQRMLSF